MTSDEKRRSQGRIARWRACGRGFDGDHLEAFAARVARDEARRVLEALRDEVDSIAQQFDAEHGVHSGGPGLDVVRDHVRELLGEPLPAVAFIDVDTPRTGGTIPGRGES